jgi:hypothetical protein
LEASLLAVVEAARRFSGTSAYEGTAARTEAAIDALMPYLPSPPLQLASGAECSVCLQPLVSTDARERTEGLALVVLPCQHIFHRSCIRTWWVQSAPSPQCAHSSACPSSESELSAKLSASITSCKVAGETSEAFFVDMSSLLVTDMDIAGINVKI